MIAKPPYFLILIGSLTLASWLSPICAEQEATDSPAEKSAAAVAAPEKQPQRMELIRGKLVVAVPGEWPAVRSRNNIIKYEFSIPAEETQNGPVDTGLGDRGSGRMTMASAGGGVEANIARWVGQFRDADGKPLGEKDKKIVRKKVAGLDVYLVDFMGDFHDKPRGPFGPTVERAEYRMLAAIIPVEENGTWFIKCYGPQATLEGAEKLFLAMIETMEFTP